MANIRVRATKTFFRNGEFIQMGKELSLPQYTANAYLTRNLVERIDENKLTSPTETKDATTDPLTYGEMTKKQLTELAKERGIEGYSKMTKPELVEALNISDDNQDVLTNNETNEGV